jgi:hypothetical protein
MMRTLVIAALAAGLLAGCSAPEAPAPGRLDEPTVDMITGSGDFAERHHRVDVTEVEVTRRCMSAAGFAWNGSANAANPEAKEGGGVSLDYLKQHGYGLSDPPADTMGPVADHTALSRALLGAEGDVATLTSTAGVVYRYPRHGCGAQAAIALYGDLDTWARFSYLPQEVNLRLGAEAEKDPRYLAKIGEWRDCMGGKYASPSAIVAALKQEYRTDRRPLAERRAAEVKLALQDVTCNKRVRLAATRLELRRELAQAVPAVDRRELARLSALFVDVERRAAEQSKTV